MRAWTLVLCLLMGCGPNISTTPAASETASRAFKNADERRPETVTPKKETQAPTVPERSTAGDISPEAFAGVKAAFESAGARVERDFTTPGGRTVRIYLPLRVAMDMTEAQAKTLAAATRGKLGENAVVYIKGPGGNTLGKASSFD